VDEVVGRLKEKEGKEIEKRKKGSGYTSKGKGENVEI
jgi:hypothetical protein